MTTEVLKDFSYVVSRLQLSLEKHDKAIKHYLDVCTARKNEYDASVKVVQEHQRERDQILDAILMLTQHQQDD